jgi:protein-tyrosine phosphatase
VADRDLNWDGCVNVRDLGGLLTNQGLATTFGVVVRADNAHGLTDAGWQQARDYGIRTVLDLRSQPESAGERPPPADFAHRRVSLFDHFDGDPAYRSDLVGRVSERPIEEQNRTLYLEALSLDAPRFAEAIRAMAVQEPGGVLVHCAHGKDRTGLLAALLLRLVNVPTEVVEADYIESEIRLGVADSAPRGVMDRVIETLEAEHGSVAAYLLHAGASAPELERVAGGLLGATHQIA